MNTKYTNIRVLVARSIETVNAGQCDDVRDCDTIAEARKFARYALSKEYMDSAEMGAPMNYARVMACEDGSDVIIVDFFGRDAWRRKWPRSAEPNPFDCKSK